MVLFFVYTFFLRFSPVKSLHYPCDSFPYGLKQDKLVLLLDIAFIHREFQVVENVSFGRCSDGRFRCKFSTLSNGTCQYRHRSS